MDSDGAMVRLGEKLLQRREVDVLTSEDLGHPDNDDGVGCGGVLHFHGTLIVG